MAVATQPGVKPSWRAVNLSDGARTAPPRELRCVITKLPCQATGKLLWKSGQMPVAQMAARPRSLSALARCRCAALVVGLVADRDAALLNET